MKLTEEVLKARAERKAGRDELAQQTVGKKEVAKAASEAKDKELMERVKTVYPELFAEFNRFKKLKAEYKTDKFDETLHWLQVKMIHGCEWKWYGIGSEIGDYSKEEKEIISGVASKYYEALENRLWAGENAVIDADELIRLIEEAGVDTFERDSTIYWATTNSVHESTRIYEMLNQRCEWWKNEQAHLPEELQY